MPKDLDCRPKAQIPSDIDLSQQWQSAVVGSRRTGRQARHLECVEFLDEGDRPMNRVVGRELDGRLYTDLSLLRASDIIVPTDQFYVRTRRSELFKLADAMTVEVSSNGRKRSISVDHLFKQALPQGRHVMECAGNDGRGHFGLVGVAEWAGVPVCTVLAQAGFSVGAGRVLISGFDTYAAPSKTSIPGASWVFTEGQLRDTGAFLALCMNGQPLTPDHGGPVRLIVPGWYGCTCIKWVNRLSVVSDSCKTTGQMREYALRTHQAGIPKLARDYASPEIEPAAIPTRIEKWHSENQLHYRVSGFAWTGCPPIARPYIQIGADGEVVPVDDFEVSQTERWRAWSVYWRPKRRGIHEIRLTIPDSKIETRRLNEGHYVRTIYIR